MFKTIFKLGFNRLLQLGAVLLFIWGLNGTLLFFNILEGNLWQMSLSLILALGTAVFALWRIYIVINLEVFKILYDQFTPQVEEFSKKVVKAVKKNIKSEHVEKGRLLSDQLAGLPWIFRFPMKILLKKIPILKLIESAKAALLEHNEDYAAKQFHKDLNDLIQEVYFDATSLKWLFWFVPLIAIGHLVLLYI